MARVLPILCCFVLIICSKNLRAMPIAPKTTPVHAISMYESPSPIWPLNLYEVLYEIEVKH